MAKTEDKNQDEAQEPQQGAAQGEGGTPTIQEQADAVLTGEGVAVDHGQGSAQALRDEADRQDAAREEATGTTRETTSGTSGKSSSSSSKSKA